MMRRPWLGFAVLIALIAIVVTLRGTSANDSPDHSSQSDGGNGTSALRYYAQALGHTTGTVEGDFSLPASHSLLFVFAPTSGYSMSEAQQLQSWIGAGNVVVYASEAGDPDLDRQFGLQRTSAGVDAAATAAAPIFGGVKSLAGAQQALAFRPNAAQVPLLRNGHGDVLAVRSSIGSGVLIALTDPLVLCNGYLTLGDNGRFAANLVAMTPAGGTVLFDEFHHGAAAGASPAVAWLSTAWGAALTLAVLGILIGLAFRGRAFGPAIPLQRRARRLTVAVTGAVGSLVQRSVDLLGSVGRLVWDT